MLFDEILLKKILDWKQDITTYLSPHTVDAYTHDVQSFLVFLTNHKSEMLTLYHFKEVTHQDVRSWLTQRQQKYKRRSTVRAFSSLKNFFSFLKKNNIIDISPLNYLRPPRLKKLLPKALSVEQAFDILDNINSDATDHWIRKRDQAFLTLIYSVGLRISEAIALNQNILKKDFFVVFGKGKKERSVPLIKEAKNLLHQYLSLCPYFKSDTAPLFYGKKGERMHPGIMQRALRKYRKEFNLPDYSTPHAFRHSCATHLINKTDNLRNVQELLGHASLSTTQIYTEIADEKLLKTYKKAHPRSFKAGAL